MIPDVTMKQSIEFAGLFFLEANIEMEPAVSSSAWPPTPQEQPFKCQRQGPPRKTACTGHTKLTIMGPYPNGSLTCEYGCSTAAEDRGQRARLPGLTNSMLHLLARAGQLRNVAGGDTLCSEGDDSSEMWVLLSGAVGRNRCGC